MPVLRDRTVYLHLEPGASGDLFLRNTIEALRRGGFAGKLRSFRCSDANDDAKDPSDLWMRDPGAFPAAMASLLTKAATVDLATALEVRQAMPTSPAGRQRLPRKVKPLDDYMAADLYAAMIEKPPVIVDGMIPAGLTVLAGRPSAGSLGWRCSWPSPSLAERLSSATTPRRGDVLYLDLESRQYRVQQRLRRPARQGAGPAAHRTEAEIRLRSVGSARRVVRTRQRPSLVIIPWAASRPDPAAGRMLMSPTLEFMASCRPSPSGATGRPRRPPSAEILPDTDRLERISGSMGLVGVCDAVIGLGGKRTEPENVQTVDSRDFDPLDLVLEFERGSWSMRSANSENTSASRPTTKIP